MKNFVKLCGLPCCDIIKPNFTRVEVGGVTLWFSYHTLVAFCAGGERVVHQNDWSNTTGKHLNEINPDKTLRCKHDEFEEKFEKLVGPLFK